MINSIILILIIVVLVGITVACMFEVKANMNLREQLRAAQRESRAYASELTNVVHELNRLANERDHLKRVVGLMQKENKKVDFTKEQINTLINLCHPDKHGGKQTANDMTAFLIQKRNSL